MGKGDTVPEAITGGLAVFLAAATMTVAFVLTRLVCKSVLLCPLGRTMSGVSVPLWIWLSFDSASSALRHFHATHTWHTSVLVVLWGAVAVLIGLVAWWYRDLRRTLRGHHVAMAMRRGRRQQHDHRSHRHHHHTPRS